MKAIVIVFVSFFFVENCGGRYHRGDLSYYNPRIPLKESTLWDEVCKDDPDYADACPEHAAIENYCKDQEEFMKKHCRKSCGLCSEETAKPPAPIVCEDDPDYADGCPKHAAIENYCKDQEEFMRKHCPKSCKFCSEGLSLQPASIECKDDPSYDCKDIAQTEGLCQEQEAFTKASCALSCGWCAPPTEKIPAPEICETDLPKWVHKCPEWADEGECDNPKRQPFMQYYCRKSCKLPCKPEPTTSAEIKPPSPPAFCSDRGANCAKWKSLGACESKRPTLKHNMAVYCGVTCGTCKEPTPEECYDKGSNCTQMKKEGYCRSTVPDIAYEVKTNCLETCEFCDLIPDQP